MARVRCKRKRREESNAMCSKIGSRSRAEARLCNSQRTVAPVVNSVIQYNFWVVYCVFPVKVLVIAPLPNICPLLVFDGMTRY